MSRQKNETRQCEPKMVMSGSHNGSWRVDQSFVWPRGFEHYPAREQKYFAPSKYGSVEAAYRVAKEWAKLKWAQYQLGRLLPKDYVPPSDEMIPKGFTARDAATKYLASVLDEKQGDALHPTYIDYRQSIEQFVNCPRRDPAEGTFGDIPISELRAETHFQEFWALRSDAPPRAFKSIDAMQRAGRHMKRLWENFSTRWILEWKPEKPCREDELMPLSKADLRQVLRTLDERRNNPSGFVNGDQSPDIHHYWKSRGVILLGALAGFRAKEMMNAHRGWFGLETNVITIPSVRHSQSDKDSAERSRSAKKTKSKKPRYVKMHPKIREWVESWPKDRTHMLFGDRGRKQIERVCEWVSKYALNGRHLHPHVLRHTFVSLALQIGISPKDVQQMTGWANLSQIEAYSHNMPGWLESAGAAMERLDAELDAKPSVRRRGFEIERLFADDEAKLVEGLKSDPEAAQAFVARAVGIVESVQRVLAKLQEPALQDQALASPPSTETAINGAPKVNGK